MEPLTKLQGLHHYDALNEVLTIYKREGNIRYVTLWIPLTLDVKVLQTYLI